MQDSKPILVSVRGIAVDGISFRHQVAIPHRYVAVRDRSSSGTETLVTVLLSLLGLGAMRTAEKFGGKAK